MDGELHTCMSVLLTLFSKIFHDFDCKSVIYVPAWFPGAEFQRWAQSARDLFYQMTRVPFFRVKQEMVRCSDIYDAK